jgi:hypothetical protein
LTEDHRRAHDATVVMEIDDFIESQGITLDGARKFGLWAGIFIVMMTAFGMTVPTFIERLDATTLTSRDWMHRLIFGAAVVFTIGTGMVASVVATKVVDRWRPSPSVPDGIADRKRWPGFPYLFAILCYSIAKPTESFRGASGLYVASDQSWLRVQAPADTAYEVIAILSVVTLGYTAGVAIKWGWGFYAASLAADRARGKAERADAARAKADS